MRFLRVVVPVTFAVALALGAVPEAGQSAAKANPTISQFLGAASPIELVSAKRADRIAWISYDQGKRNVYYRGRAGVRAGARDVVPQGRRRGADRAAHLRRRFDGGVHARQRGEP
jgi:hypothetical protein